MQLHITSQPNLHLLSTVRHDSAQALQCPLAKITNVLLGQILWFRTQEIHARLNDDDEYESVKPNKKNDADDNKMTTRC
jgi:hypothetical protein